jgi:hypothetical protein
MPALTESKVVEPRVRASCTDLGGRALYREVATFSWTQAALMAVRLVGLALATGGFLIGVGVLWTHLARALHLARLFHRARALRAIVLVAAGSGLLVFGRRR